MSTELHPTKRLPVRTVGVEAVVGRVSKRPDTPLERLVIGSDPSADLVLDDPSVSAFHVELCASGSGVRVRDLSSTNGVVSGTTYLDEAVVPPDTLLELGRACVRVERGGAQQVEAASAVTLGALICRSAVMRRLAHRVGALAEGELPVLIEGPSGSGKELLARTLHEQSDRAKHPFVVLDCGALSEALGQSEIFGHEKGAFTDAVESRVGALERAGLGTLVLDEIETLSPLLQPAFLGVLERRRFRRMGANKELTLGARLIVTSSADLRREVNRGRLRLDLYYRLAGARLVMPSLSERLDDLGPLVCSFLDELGHGPSHPLASEAEVERLAQQTFTENVRGLRNALWQRLTVGEEPPDEPPQAEAPSFEALLEDLRARPYKDARARFEAAFEQHYLRHLAAQAGGTVSAAARLAGLDRAQLRQLARRAGVLLRK